MHRVIGVSSHVSYIRVGLIVVVDRQEICIHRFHILTTGFAEHIPQRRESLFVPLECEQLIIVVIQQISTLVMKYVRATG